MESWERRFAEYRRFLAEHDRHPSRHWPKTAAEASLAWWAKDQRRKLTHGASDSRKRGVLTAKQARKLQKLGIEPRRGRPGLKQLRRRQEKKGSARRTYTPKPAPCTASAPDPKAAAAWLAQPGDPDAEIGVSRLWLRRLRELAKFISEHARLPIIDYTSPRHEVELGRWLAKQLAGLRKYPRANRNVFLSAEQHALLLKAGFRVTPIEETEAK